MVLLSKGTRATREYIAVSSLVLRAFVGEPSPGQVPCHSPDPSHRNNRLDNLSWRLDIGQTDDSTHRFDRFPSYIGRSKA
jgi:hypothetical protein